ncbi:MAG: aminodeoxychorismate/anthranilate synthase component II [Phycisphaeraceae bacterium]|nr:aminodeoxychorismate/anthranilate synthase component II [Phycisphaeraceae bacterium]MCB9848132.1 aminodeoxychorismate/anthranilate synthase component II [Phycisphaeraceae bacterium]
MLLIIDNYDSFTWNLVQRIGELDPSIDMRVVRNDQITADEARTLKPSHIVISPGPCTPAEAGVSRDIVDRLGGKVPILGVCLGHQCIGDRHGMTVARHARIVHGKTSDIHHDATGLFEGLPNPFTATRYHSLVVTRDSIPAAGWAVSAWTNDTLDDGTTAEVVMGLRRVFDDPDAAPLLGVQFHPESFLTTHGPLLLANFLGLPRPTLASTA